SLQKKYEKFYQLGYSLLYDNIDTSLFRSDVDVEKAFQLIQWAIDGYQNNLIHRLQGKNLSSYNFDPLWEEFFEYLNVLKTAFYNR
ncbi:MAG TPA: TetR/AcrR family transcriptional regulator, partial [Pseudogracilibacillus sp.]|nr:TetR/AcrR family transcriptional regulator [Pseudogracilibacillus sp.]